MGEQGEGKAIPLHRQIERTLAEEIRTGHWPVGGALPSEPELARRFKVSRMTVRQALGDLADHGLLIKQRGRATRVASESIAQPLGRFYAFTQEMERLGCDHSSLLVRVGLASPSSTVSAALVLAAGEAVAQITLLRLLGTEPLMIETASFRATALTLLQSPQVTKRSLYSLLDEAGLKVTRATQRIRPIALTATQARLLGVRARLPAFLVQRTSYMRDMPVELRESVVRGDRYSFVAELRREEFTADIDGEPTQT